MTDPDLATLLDNLLRKHAPAVPHVVDTYLRDLERKRFLQKVREGRSDYALTNDELEARGRYDAH